MTHRIVCLVIGLMLGTVPAIFSAHAQDVRTFNIDFGNGPAYVGDDGILSSPGGTYWNKVTVQSFPPGSGNAAHFDVPPLLDEFGQPFGEGHLLNHPEYRAPELVPGFFEATANTASAAGPLADGVTLPPNGNFFGFTLRVLSRRSPITLVVYFNNPTSEPNFTNTISLNYDYFEQSATNPTGSFPGVAGHDYLRFDNVPRTYTTLSEQFPLHGVIINVPYTDVDNIASIAAIQIRGQFVFVPEPAPLLLTGMVAACCLCHRKLDRRLIGMEGEKTGRGKGSEIFIQ